MFVLNYSVAPNRFPLQLREVAAVMELLHRNAEQWHCDVSHVAIMGFSAGGHLAAHYSTAYDCSEIRDVFPRSKPVQAAILCYPVITADPKWAHLGSFDALICKKVRNKEEIKKFSCNKHVTKDTPPTFLWHTAEDADVSVMNSLLYAQALAEKGVPFEYHVFPKGSMVRQPATSSRFPVLKNIINITMCGWTMQKNGCTAYLLSECCCVENI